MKKEKITSAMSKTPKFQKTSKTPELLKVLKDRNGLTLIELIAVVAVMAIVIVPLVGTFMTGYKAFYKEDENIKATRCARTAMERVVDKIRKADPKDITYEDGVLKIDKVEMDEDYAFAGIDGVDELKDKDIDAKAYFYEVESEGGEKIKKIDKVSVTVDVEGIRTGEYELSTDIYIRRD